MRRNDLREAGAANFSSISLHKGNKKSNAYFCVDPGHRHAQHEYPQHCAASHSADGSAQLHLAVFGPIRRVGNKLTSTDFQAIHHQQLRHSVTRECASSACTICNGKEAKTGVSSHLNNRSEFIDQKDHGCTKYAQDHHD
jgi:hypothetical protein